ncbi:MAG: ankyrin repeat domain-containing protein [Gammaproteobacteria bacterium]|nr:ankyrin repeat domain-containing protein [Rhodocyclaceae bacterium]MBU3910016.1 ankyrin repeat domain-containing protein [Gammaproteobacteria bacterium]MBU3989902.1 ankyrin repeat domain-containing protein [Gammaproteobacteria bacterium]MBU4003989.1 ankyrin repeat domain-containing protein [Gammaproteobacteria bacterium]MBU4020236.1 ankyrin repeat domain-containing protein [Gammaproteobacteria bacterium]
MKMNRLIVLLFLTVCQLLPVTAQAELPDPSRFSVAMELGNVSQARAWLDEGLDPNFEGALIGTGLMIGAWEGNIPLMELFVERGADLNRINRQGETALMLAAWKGKRAAMQWLLERGAAPNRSNRAEREWTALHYAVFAGHAELTERLLTAGADVNARSTNGSTVVMMAAREGHEAIAQRLMAAGANPAMKNDFEDDAVAWAMRQGNYRIAQTFTSAENFAELARAAVANPLPKPQRSTPVSDRVEEHLRMARLAEAKGQRGAALAAYRKALTELKAQPTPPKVGADKTASGAKPTAKAPNALVIRAKRGQPEQQSAALSYTGGEEAGINQLLEQARAAEAAGRRTEALQLFRRASERIKANQQ